MFGFIVLLHFYDANPEDLTRRPLPGSGCIYLGHWMLQYPDNELWSETPFN